MQNEIRHIEVMIALAEGKTLYNVLPACREKQLLGAEIVEYNTELLQLRSRTDVRNRLKFRSSRRPQQRPRA